MNEQLPVKKYLLAILFSLLVIPAAFVIAPIFLLLKNVTGVNLGDLLVGLPFGLGIPGFLLSSLILFLLFLVKTLVPAVITWFITHSKKLVGVTFVSAIAVQIFSNLIVSPTQQLQEQATQQIFQEFAAEKGYKESVAVEQPTFDLIEPLPVDPYPQYGQAFSKLMVSIPVTAKIEGQYRIKTDYSAVYNSGRDGSETREVYLTKGNNVVIVELTSADFKLPIYWFRQSISRVEITVS